MIQVIQGSLRCPAGRCWWVRLQHLDTRRHRRCSPYPGVSESPRNMGNMYCWYVDINNLDIHGEIFMENLEHDGDSMGIFQAFCSKIPSPLANNDEPMMGSWIHTLVIFTELSPATVELELSPPDRQDPFALGKIVGIHPLKGEWFKNYSY